MNSFYKLTNEIRDYAWGDDRYIPDFLNIPNPDGKPFAELWMGAHPGAPSMIAADDGNLVSLHKWIAEEKESALGPEVSSRYGRLPYLFKLLAAGDSLSIQAHPSKAMAEEGFAREDKAGIPRDAPERNYKDDNHKPEIIMAISVFTAMIGFRTPAAILENISELDFDGVVPGFIQEFRSRSATDESAALKLFIEGLLLADTELRKKLLDFALKASEKNTTCWDSLQKKWVTSLIKEFPGDIGALAPLFLNVLEIQPGEALYQPAGELHAYLEGFGLELMANSDNVLRGGLTGKYIDVPELLKLLNFKSIIPEILQAEDAAETGGIRSFSTPVDEFILKLARLENVETGTGISISSGQGPLIVLSLEGTLVLNDGSEDLILTRGESAFIPWNALDITLSGTGRAALAGTAL